MLSILSTTTTEKWISIQLLQFISIAFKSLDIDSIRKEVAPLVSIQIWSRLSSESLRNNIISQTPTLKKLWKHSQKKLKKLKESKDANDKNEYTNLIFYNEWLFSSIMNFFQIIYKSDNKREISTFDNLYATKFIEFLVILVSQLPTRRFVNTLLTDIHIIPVIKQSHLYTQAKAKENHLFLEFVNLLDFYIHFPIDDFSGSSLEEDRVRELITNERFKLRQLAFSTHPEKLKLLAYTNLGALGDRQDLIDFTKPLSDTEFVQFCKDLNIRTSFPLEFIPINQRSFLTECFIARYEDRPTIQQFVMGLETMPTETSLFAPILSQTDNYSPSSPLPIPTMSLQYLSVTDFLVRAFQLFRYESFFEIKQDIINSLQRIKPSTTIVPITDDQGVTTPQRELRLGGSSKMVAKLASPVAILEVAPPKIGSYSVGTAPKDADSNHIKNTSPGYVKAEIVFDLYGYNSSFSVVKEWDSLRPGDVIFLAELATPNTSSSELNTTLGLRHLRSAEIIQIYNNRDVPIHQLKRNENNDLEYDSFDEDEDEDNEENDKRQKRGRTIRRKIQVYLDPTNYGEDSKVIYKNLNAVFRRKQKENNFFSILENIKSVALEKVAIPEWFSDVFLGFGDPDSASYEKLYQLFNSDSDSDISSTLLFPQKVNYPDTFLDSQHLIESFPQKVIEFEPLEKSDQNPTESEAKSVPLKRKSSEDNDENLANTQTQNNPPYILPGYIPKLDSGINNQEGSGDEKDILKVVSYKEPIVYKTFHKKNSIRFTPRQVEALVKACSPGLSMVIGPPGTGKTDVAVQMVNNIYHNFPEERTLVIAHSNQALNHIFEKIAELDIDDKHLLRLGGGEELIDDRIRNVEGESFSKYGRVERLLQAKPELLSKVTKLAESMDIAGAVAFGDSIDSALSFYEIYVAPLWKKYQDKLKRFGSEKNNKNFITELVTSFPFSKYFSPNGNKPEDGLRRIFFDENKQALNEKNNNNNNNITQQSTNDDNNNNREVGAPLHDMIESEVANGKLSLGDVIRNSEGAYYCEIVEKLFKSLEEIRPFEIIKNNKERSNYMLVKHAKIVAMTATYALMKRNEIRELGFHYNNIVVEEAAQLTEIETMMLLTLQKQYEKEDEEEERSNTQELEDEESELPAIFNGEDSSLSTLECDERNWGLLNSLRNGGAVASRSCKNIQRIIFIGDDCQNSPIVQNSGLCQYGRLDQSLFSRLVRLKAPVTVLNFQGRARPELVTIYDWQYRQLESEVQEHKDRSLSKREEKGGEEEVGGYLQHLPRVLNDVNLQPQTPNYGLLYNCQFIDVESYQGQGETEPSPHFIQNLGEAEYAVALYQYMRLLGYPKEKITILSAYYGQKKLIEEIIFKRCGGNRHHNNNNNQNKTSINEIFGYPGGGVKTIDEYQGEQNDFIIVSLVRTKRLGYLRDRRRLTVAFSRARRGLYVIGNAKLMKTLAEEEEIMRRVLEFNNSGNKKKKSKNEEGDHEHKLMIVTGEMYKEFPTTTTTTMKTTEKEEGGDDDDDSHERKKVKRSKKHQSNKKNEDEKEENKKQKRTGFVIEGVEHIGQYVYEMANTRINYLSSK